MKHGKMLLAVLLLATMLLTVCAPSAALAAPANQSAGRPLAALDGELVPTRVQTTMFRAKFEGSAVAGTGEIVDGVYRFTATDRLSRDRGGGVRR